MQEGLTYNIIKENPSLMLKDLAKLQQNIAIMKTLKAKEECKRVEFKDLRALGFHHPQISDSISITPENKKCHLWLTGPPNSGKTYFLEKMMELGIKGFQGPYNNDYMGFDQDLHQLIFWDEFKGQLTIQ